ncbi:MAG: hypothetical protein U0231_03100 [Nitrospiraceae bacterium]
MYGREEALEVIEPATPKTIAKNSRAESLKSIAQRPVRFEGHPRDMKDRAHSIPTTSVHGFSPVLPALGLEASLLATLDRVRNRRRSNARRFLLVVGRDVLEQAATGTDERLRSVCRCSTDRACAADQRPSALILVPTRGLAVQVGEGETAVRKKLRMSVLAIYGGQAMGPASPASCRVDVVVAAPVAPWITCGVRRASGRPPSRGLDERTKCSIWGLPRISSDSRTRPWQTDRAVFGFNHNTLRGSRPSLGVL